MATTKKTPKTTKKLAGKAREEQSKQLFKNIREYHLLGFRIGDGLRNMFNTLVTSISKNKASVNPVYTYTIHGGTDLVVFNFGISVASKKKFLYSVDVVVNKDNSAHDGLTLSIVPKASNPPPEVKGYQLSEQGIRDMLKEIGVVK